MSRYVDVDELHKQGWVASRYKNWEPTPLNDNFKLEIEVKPFNTFHSVDIPRWIPVAERLPQNTDPVNITLVNRKPSGYNEHIKDKPFVATGHYCNGRWYWFSAVCQDYLNEYGDCEMDRVNSAVEIIAWMPLPSPYKGGEEE